ncbi:MAG TPA: flagellar basal-body rod protein FlgG [Nitrospirae bacterium]|nr:flagellar basal-body rod protein FlgG [bacterium BMS3Abin06]HDH13233.1 flagellar basal-body rod protein FlgG [Nitrospirota bacterium]HDZ01799.1 flagellar basal-body rod protein FlgG [Nitrospirota bacterium]
MDRALFIAATGMEAQRINIDVISNNLANVNTGGFKKSRADFQELLYQSIRTAGAVSAEGTEVPTGIQIGLGVKPAAVQKIFTQGDFVSTGNDLDLVIEGKGFFQVSTPDGEIAYTRSGAFKLDSEGKIVNSDGYAMEPSITIPSNTLELSITPDGTVSVLQAGSNTTSEVGQIEIAQFINPGGLKALGKNLFSPTGSSGDAATGNPGSEGLGAINQGFLEMSNVNVVEEMVNMIISQRAYELNSKAIQTADEMLQLANNIKR